MDYNVELYREGNSYCAYISTNGDSGYKIVAATPQERADEIRDYFANLEDD